MPSWRYGTQIRQLAGSAPAGDVAEALLGGCVRWGGGESWCSSTTAHLAPLARRPCEFSAAEPSCRARTLLRLCSFFPFSRLFRAPTGVASPALAFLSAALDRESHAHSTAVPVRLQRAIAARTALRPQAKPERDDYLSGAQCRARCSRLHCRAAVALAAARQQTKHSSTSCAQAVADMDILFWLRCFQSVQSGISIPTAVLELDLLHIAPRTTLHVHEFLQGTGRRWSQAQNSSTTAISAKKKLSIRHRARKSAQERALLVIPTIARVCDAPSRVRPWPAAH